MRRQGAWPFLVPQVDEDGNELAGIRLPDQAVPIGTLTGWNFRAPNSGNPNAIVPLLGSLIPFAKTAADRGRDPRKSLEERYRGKSDYLGRVTESALELVKQGYVLREDLPFLLERAAAGWDWVAQRPASSSTACCRNQLRTYQFPRHVDTPLDSSVSASWANPWPAISSRRASPSSSIAAAAARSRSWSRKARPPPAPLPKSRAAAKHIITMLPDGPDVSQVLEDENGVFGAMSKGTVIVDSSTIAPAIARRLAARAKELGASMLDAPVSGGEIGAIDGTLTFMVGGDAAALESVRDDARARWANPIASCTSANPAPARSARPATRSCWAGRWRWSPKRSRCRARPVSIR